MDSSAWEDDMYENLDGASSSSSTHKFSRKPMKANHLLNFNVERRLQTKETYHSYTYKNPIRFHSQEQFLQANFQFIVNSEFVYEQNPDQHIRWDHVKVVVCHEESFQELSKCPICLDPPHAPRITRCGHIFCLTCLLRMFQATLSTQESTKVVSMEGNLKFEVNARFKQCPICTDNISLEHLKPVKLLIAPKEYKENSICEFVLLRRHKSVFISQKVENYSPAGEFTLPSHTSENSKFSKFHLDSDHQVIKDLLSSEVHELKLLKNNAETDEIRFIELAVHQLAEYLKCCSNTVGPSGNIESLKAVQHEGRKEIQSNSLFLYQEESGQNIFLHPLTSRAILNEYGSYINAPSRIVGKIIEMEEISIDSQSRKRYKFLSHLPLYSQCKICELDMRPLVSKKALEPLLPKIKKRIYLRKQKKLEEQRVDRKRKKQEAKLFHVDRETEINFDEFDSLSSLHGMTDVHSELPVEQNPVEVKPPVWVKDTAYYQKPRIPKKLVAAPTVVRRVKGSDGESDEELAAPSFAASFYQDISFEEPLDSNVPQESSQKKTGKRRKQRKKKQLLFSTSSLPYG